MGVKNSRGADSPCFSSPGVLDCSTDSFFPSTTFIMRICHVLREGFLLIICYKVVIVNAVTCYWPNGTEVEQSQPMQACNSTVNGADSGCCAPADICTNRGFCISTNNSYMYRGGCTNQAWNLDVCFAECLDEGIAAISCV